MGLLNSLITLPLESLIYSLKASVGFALYGFKQFSIEKLTLEPTERVVLIFPLNLRFLIVTISYTTSQVMASAKDAFPTQTGDFPIGGLACCG